MKGAGRQDPQIIELRVSSSASWTRASIASLAAGPLDAVILLVRFDLPVGPFGARHSHPFPIPLPAGPPPWNERLPIAFAWNMSD